MICNFHQIIHSVNHYRTTETIINAHCVCVSWQSVTDFFFCYVFCFVLFGCIQRTSHHITEKNVMFFYAFFLALALDGWVLYLLMMMMTMVVVVWSVWFVCHATTWSIITTKKKPLLVCVCVDILKIRIELCES